MKLLRAGLAMLFLALASPAFAASVPLVNPQQLQIPSTGVDFNNLIQAINAILTPLIPNVGGSVNTIELLPAVTGGTAIVNLGTTADANAPIGLAPNGNGNIVLWAGDMSGTGVLQFGNLASFVSAPSLAPFPGQLPWAAGIQGVHNTVQGVLLFKDWLGFTRGVAAY